MTLNDDTRDEELIARYRQASADAPDPSDAVRAAILAEGRRVAELAKQAPQKPFDVSRPAANDPRWKFMGFGTAGAALLAALLFAPRYWENAPPAQVSMAPPPAPAAARDQNDEAPKLAEAKPYVAPANSSPARPSPGESTSLQGVVATAANRKSSKSYGAVSPNPAASAPALPPSAAQNYAPVSPSASNLIVKPSAPAALTARARARELSAQTADSAAPSVMGGLASRAHSEQKPATLQSAVAQGDLAQSAFLLDQGAVIDARDEAGRTPLMLAVTQDRLEIVRLLLARGADPNAADNSGHTPLQQATKRNLRDVAALLEQAGAH